MVVVRMGTMGAFAPVSFKQWVLSTRPQKKKSMKSIKTIEKLTQKSGERFKLYAFLSERRKNTNLEKILHPSCENPNDVPDLEGYSEG